MLMVTSHLFSHPFNKYLLNTYYVPGTYLGAGDVVVNRKDKVPAFMKFTF